MKILLSIYLVGLSFCGKSQQQALVDSARVPSDSLVIELKALYHPMPKVALVTLKYDGKNWSVTKCANCFKKDGKTADITPKDKSLLEVYRRLLACDVFVLPSQYEIAGIIEVVNDGIGYTLSFKTGTTSGRYIFDNPDEYVKVYPGLATFQKYKNIADIFFKELYRE